MQIAFQFFYPERSITYLARAFDQLKSGDDYSAILPCIQISILDTEMFRKDDSRYTDAFYSEYILKERISGKEFSDKFTLRVLSLRHIENAANKADPNGLYQWAKLFKANSWEDLKMIAQENSYMKSMVSGLKILSEDEKIQMACEARKRDACDRASLIHSAKEEVEKKYEPLLAKQKAALAAQENEIATLKARLAQLTK